MSIDYKAKLLVGLPYNELESLIGEGDIWETIGKLGLDYASPYYDADHDEWVVGVKVASTSDYQWTTVDVSEHKKAADEFTRITGLVGKLILSPHGY